ncbi:MAG: hypothetical protein ACHQ7N_18365 [Candidatus Methylomirabilales bacterium]
MWLYLSGAVALSYAFYPMPTPTVRPVIGMLEYVPFLFLLVWQWRGRKQDQGTAPGRLAAQGPQIG